MASLFKSSPLSLKDTFSPGPFEERKGLLSGIDTLSTSETDESKQTPLYDRSTSLSFCRAGIILSVCGFFGLAFGVFYWLSAPPSSAKALHFDGEILRSNGTHGADYLDRGLTPHLLDISKEGLRAKFMKPIFPTLTFPNHWALMTGLYAESHGIIANNFWDAETDSEFHYSNISSCWQPHWWYGEPMWETAGKAGLITANLMWPGPPQMSSGATPTYFVPWANKVSLNTKLAQILKWIDLPLDERPQLILAYEPSLDQAGHATGPYSQEDTLKYVDTFAKDLRNSLVARNLTEIVDVIFVSDHGMTDTSHPELVYIDDVLGEEGWRAVKHEDGWPSMGLHFDPSANSSHYLERLLAAAAENSEKFSVHTPETMPERYHFAHSTRIAPVYVIPKIGYVLTNRKEGDVGLSKGNHGYDNNDPTMNAIFVAHGPFSTVAKAVHYSQSTSPRPRWLLNPNNGWYSASDDTYVMEGFENIEIYNLIMKLLDIQSQAAKTNGTIGFWDRYL
ncbi:Phosphodiest-domain-containing protein [Multifurca ochricompacta]|uniref:Phosphodiest-domain-containing protein n=1 Tax=Multifurca ochricompacta TaxID=376703 RepID=A0AAD4M759_9AGAM|nr:Phosphodiest-domain-containing protein [Multifurca ochricompacta]